VKQISQSVADRTDPRAEKTRAALAAAFVALLGRRSYDRIRVSDITRKAAIGRATFYAHFASKDALLHSELVRVVLPKLAELREDACPVDATALFGHVHHARGIYRSILGGAARGVTERVIQEALESRVRAIFAERGARETAGGEFAPRFVASTLLSLLAWSLEQPVAPSAAALQGMLRSLVGRALS